MKVIFLGGMAFLGMISSQVNAGTCALCREALASGGGSGLLTGFYWSIVLIVSVSLIIFAFGFHVIRRHWR